MSLFGLNSCAVGVPTFRRVVLRDGVEVFVNDRATGRGAAEYRTCELVVHSDRQAIIRPTLSVRALYIGCLVVGLVMLMVVLMLMQTSPRIDKVAYLCVLGGPLGIFGLLGVLGVIGPKRVILDGVAGVVAIPRGCAIVPELKEGLPLSRLAALQLCWWTQHATRRIGKYTKEEYTYTMYELNAILAGGNGERFVLMTDNEPARLNLQAKQLSMMFGLPIIDSITPT